MNLNEEKDVLFGFMIVMALIIALIYFSCK